MVSKFERECLLAEMLCLACDIFKIPSELMTEVSNEIDCWLPTINTFFLNTANPHYILNQLMLLGFNPYKKRDQSLIQEANKLNKLLNGE